jgi:hypothetical protein
MKDSYIIWIIFGGLVALGIWLSIGLRSDMKKRKEMYDKLDDPVELNPVDTFNVKVVNKYCDTVREGSVKYPRSRKACFISFEFEDGNIKTYEVDEDRFETIFYGDNGELAVSDGEFLDFSKIE